MYSITKITQILFVTALYCRLQKVCKSSSRLCFRGGNSVRTQYSTLLLLYCAFINSDHVTLYDVKSTFRGNDHGVLMPPRGNAALGYLLCGQNYYENSLFVHRVKNAFSLLSTKWAQQSIQWTLWIVGCTSVGKKRMRMLKYFMFTILRRLCLSWTKGTAMLHVVMKKWLLLLAPYAKYIQQRGWLCVIVCPRKSHIYVSKWNVLHCVNCGDAIQLSNLKGSLTRALFLPLA